MAKAQGSVVPPSVGTPLPSTPATAPTPTQPPAQPPRTSTPVPVSRGVKREFEDNALVPQGPGPGSVGVSSSDGVSPTMGQAQRPGSAKAGVPGVRPRPLKKQRVVSHVLLFLCPDHAEFGGGVTRLTQVGPCVIFSGCHGWRHLPLSVATSVVRSFDADLVRLSPPGRARPSERHASASTNTTAYSARCIMLSGAALCPFLKCYIIICHSAFDL